MSKGHGGHVYRPRFKNKAGRICEGNWRIRLTYRDATGAVRVLDKAAPALPGAERVTKNDALEFLNAQRSKIFSRTMDAAIRAEDLTYEEMRADLIRAYEEKGNRTLLVGRDGRKYISSLNHLDAAFGGYRALAINARAIDGFKDARRAVGASNASINRSLELIRAALRLQVKKGALLPTDVPYFSKLKEPAARKGMLASRDYPRLLAALPYEWLRAATTLGYFTGMRLGEIRRLRWETVDLAARLIHLSGEETKNKTPRDVPIPATLMPWLEIWRLKYPDAIYVFGYGSSRPLGSFRKIWIRTCLKVGLGRMVAGRYAGLRFHDLRRGAVTRMIEAGVPVHTAMAISGHISAEVFRKYLQVQNSTLQDAMRKAETEETRQSTGKVDGEGEGKDARRIN